MNDDIQPRTNSRKALRLLISDLLATFGNKPLLYCGLIIAQGVVESLAVASIMPLLSLVGMKAGANGDIISRLLSFFSITPTLSSVSIFLWVGLFVSAVFFLAQAKMGTAMQAGYTAIWRKRVTDALQFSRLSAIRTHSTGKLLNVLTYESLRCGDIIYQINLITSAALHTITTFIVACMLSSIVTVSMVILGAFLFLLSRRYLRHAYILGQNFSRDNEALNGAVHNALGGLKYLKATGTESAGLAPVHTLRLRLERTARHMMYDVQKAKAVFDFGGATIFAILLVGLPFYTGVDVTAIITILALFVRLLPRLVGLQQGLQMMNVTLPAIETLHDVYTQLQGDSKTQHHHKYPIPSDINTGPLPIQLDAVDVTINGNAILKGISGTIPAGQWLTIVGASGAGKSTLLDVICGLTAPTSGSVSCAHHQWAELEHTEFRSRIGFVEQDTVIFSGTIADNLSLGLVHISEADMQFALKQAGLTSLCESLQQAIGEGGRILSGGERQRLSIARGLLRNPGILVLDEATSALDSKTEQAILETLAALKGKFTIIMTTHRPAATHYANEIWLMHEGQLAEQGSQATLETSGGLFTKWLHHAKAKPAQ